MKNNNIISIAFSTVVFFSCASNKNIAQQNTDLTTLKFTAEEDTGWTNLFNRKHGWFGADGVFTR